MPEHINDAENHQRYTTAPIEASAQQRHPETFRLPRQNDRDPFWNLSRAWYYEAEKAGLLKLIRLRKNGNSRGVTLVPFRAVAELVRSAAEGRD